MLSLTRLSLSQLAGMTLGQLASLPMVSLSPVYSVRLRAVQAFTTARDGAAIGTGTTLATGGFLRTVAAQSAGDDA